MPKRLLPNSFLDVLGFRLRTFRQQRGFTQKQLASKAAVDETYLQRIETGHQSPSYLLLIRLARALRISVRRFFP